MNLKCKILIFSKLTLPIKQISLLFGLQQLPLVFQAAINFVAMVT
jgi:hypothetical protein